MHKNKAHTTKYISKKEVFIVCEKEEKEMRVVKKEELKKKRKDLILSLLKKACDKYDEALKKLSK